MEKRQYLRLEANLSVRCRETQDSAAINYAISKNISAGGIMISLKNEMPIGKKIHLEIKLPGEEGSISIIGEVAWQQDKPQGGSLSLDTGVKFLEIKTCDRQKLTRYLLEVLKEKTKGDPEKASSAKKNILDVFSRHIRLPGDKSRNINAPDFLIHEINIPGDKVRFARIKTNMGIKYKLLDGAGSQGQSLGQYISGGSIWMLLEKELKPGIMLELSIELPGCPGISVIGKVDTSQAQIRYGDQEAKMYYETNVKFTGISASDRKNIVRYVYSCRKDYFMLGKNLPPDWI